MPLGPCFRGTRAALFAVVSVILAALGHVLMSGTAVPWWTVLVAGGVTGAVGWSLTGEERGFPVVLSVVVAVQALLHSWFALAQVATRPAGTSDAPIIELWIRHMLCQAPAGTSADHTHHLTAGMPAMPDAVTLGAGQSGMTSSGMLSAHLLAALLCGLWLAYGERAAFQCLRACAGWVVAPLRRPRARPVPAALPRVRAASPRTIGGPRRPPHADAVTSRGPPTGTAVV
ncbi:hypothetical protein [Streptomyces sp. NPDC058595]|uniref:hypothetical protein n=1 Tax=Streptomyces sp. NPDC058595 TaxID=3346550 RepID=UPI0036578D9F